MAVTFHKDTEKLDGMLKQLRAMKGRRAEVGIFQSKAGRLDNTSIDNVDLAVIHEFGAPSAGIPERSHFRSTMAKGKGKYLRQLASLMGSLEKSPDHPQEVSERALGIVGEVIAGDIKQAIADGLSPALKPATIARKGSSTPLIDTGSYRASIASRVTSGVGNADS